MRWLALLLWLWVIAPAQAQTWHPGIAANVPIGAYIGSPGTNCASGYAYAAKLGRMPDYWAYYTPDEGSTTAQFKSGVSADLPAFANAGCKQNIVVKIRMITNDAQTVFMTYKSVAAGTYDTDYWTYLANALISAGYTTPVIIIAWEQNGNFYSWSDNYVVMDGGTGTGLMLPLAFNHSTGAITSIGALPQYTAGHGYTAGDVVTVDDGTCSSTPSVNIVTVHTVAGITGVPNTFSVNTAGACTTAPGPGGWIAAFQHISNLIKTAIPGAIIAFDPNCFSGTNGWNQDYPGDGFVDLVGIDCYDQSNTSNLFSAGTAALPASGSVTINNQPITPSILHTAIFPGSSAITAGTVSITYVSSGSHTEMYPLATAASGESDFYTALATGTVSSISVSGLVGGTNPKIGVYADQPPARWYYSLHETDGLTSLKTIAATTANSACAGSPSPCLSTINVTVGGSKTIGLLETGSYNGPNTGTNFIAVNGNDDPYWMDQEAQFCATAGPSSTPCSMVLFFEQTPALMFGHGTGYVQPGIAGAVIQDYAP